MIIKTGEETKIDAFLDTTSDNPKMCKKCGRKIVILKIDDEKIEPMCECQMEEAMND